MFDIKYILEQELRYQKNMEQVYLGELKNLPEGSLSLLNIKGKDYFYKYAAGERTYLGGRKSKEIEDLQARKIISTCLKRIKHNQVLMEKVLEKYQSIDLENVRLSLSRAYQRDSLDVLSANTKKNKNWGDQDYQRSTLHPEALVHRTLKGDFVRSKSEVIIANTLYMKGLEYRSEELTKVGSHIFAPDFKILAPSTNKVKILEHFGMMNNPEYREKALKKMSTYIENGYRPYEDILFTFDDLNGNIDAMNLELLITSFCM